MDLLLSYWGGFDSSFYFKVDPTKKGTSFCIYCFSLTIHWRWVNILVKSPSAPHTTFPCLKTSWSRTAVWDCFHLGWFPAELRFVYVYYLKPTYLFVAPSLFWHSAVKTGSLLLSGLNVGIMIRDRNAVNIDCDMWLWSSTRILTTPPTVVLKDCWWRH